MYYSKYKSEETFLKCLKAFKALITPEYWEKDDKGKIIQNQKWIDKEFEYELKIFAPFALDKPDIPVRHTLTFKKTKGQQYSEDYLNGELINGASRPSILDYITDNLGQEFKALYFYLGSWINLEFADYKYLSQVKEDAECLLIDFNKPSYVELFKITTMPQLSEKASVNKETGEIRIKEHSSTYWRTLKKIFHKEKVEVDKTKAASEGKTYVEKKTKPYFNDGLTNQQRKEAKKKSRKENGLIKKSHTIRIIKRIPASTQHQNALVCIKHTDGSIFRVAKFVALNMMQENEGMYKFCSKGEWKSQEAKKPAKVATKQKINQSKRDHKIEKAKNALRATKFKLDQIDGKPNNKILVKQPEKIKRSYNLSYYVEKDSPASFKERMIDVYSLTSEKDQNTALHLKTDKIENRLKKHYENGRLMISIGESQNIKKQALKRQKKASEVKVEEVVKLVKRQKLKVDKTKNEETGNTVTHSYLINIPTESVTTFKVTRKRTTPSPFKKTGKKWKCPMPAKKVDKKK